MNKEQIQQKCKDAEETFKKINNAYESLHIVKKGGKLSSKQPMKTPSKPKPASKQSKKKVI